MFNFSIPAKIRVILSRLPGAIKHNKTDPSTPSVTINNVKYHIKLRSAKYHNNKNLFRLSQSSRKTLIKSNNFLFLYKITKNDKVDYEICLEIKNFGQVYSLLQTASDKEALNEFDSNLMSTIVFFVPYFVEKGRGSFLTNLLELLECYRDNPCWKIAHFAAYFNYVNYFQDKSVFENVEDEDTNEKWSPMHIAALLGNIEIIKLIVKSGIDMYFVDARQWTVMHYAVLGPPRVVSLLVEMPAFYDQLRCVDVNGCTPLHIACLTGKVYNFQRLLLQGLTAKMLSISAPKPIIDQFELYLDSSLFITFTIKEVTEELDVQSFSYAGCPLHWVDSWPLLERLISTKAFRINLRNSLGDTPLISFIKRVGLVVQSNQGNTASISSNNHAAGSLSPTTTGNVSMSSHINDRMCWLLKLIISGARINATNEECNTALHYAVINCDIVSLQMLIIFGARINLRNKLNQSPLHLAATILAAIQNQTSSAHQKNINELTNSNKCSYDKLNALINNNLSSLTKGLSSSSKFQIRRHISKVKIRSQAAIKGYKHILTLLQSVGARRCPKDLEGCDIQCAHSKIDRQKIKKTKSTLTSMSTDCSIPEVFIVNLTDEAKKYLNHIKSTSKSSFRMVSENSINRISRRNSTDKGELSVSKIKQSSSSISRTNVQKQPQLPNMLVLDGGYTEGGIKPLIQALLLNELQTYLNLPLMDYFELVAGSGYGSVTASMLSIGRTIKEAFYFFLKLKELFKTPLIPFQDQNTGSLEKQLQKEFGTEILVKDIQTKHNKFLLLTTCLIDRDPVKLEFIESFSGKNKYNEMPLWEACRASGAGLGTYNAYGSYYDGSLLSSNPTMDFISYYHNYVCRINEEKITEVSENKDSISSKEVGSTSQARAKNNQNSLLPLTFVASVGSGLVPWQTNLTPTELNNYSTFNPAEILKNINYFRHLKDLMLQSLIQTDNYVSERCKVWCQTLDISYGRINVNFDKEQAKERSTRSYLKLSGGMLKSGPTSVSKANDDILLQILWDVKVQLYQHRHKFSKIAKFLETKFEANKVS